MFPRRDENGWRNLGPVTWNVERFDNHGDRSTSTRITIIWTAHVTYEFRIVRPWLEN